jgi:hypothetical protein
MERHVGNGIWVSQGKYTDAYSVIGAINASQWRRGALLAVCVMSVSLGGCSLRLAPNRTIQLSEPPSPIQSGPSEALTEALTCIRESKVLNKVKFAVAVHSDGTGKTSYGYEGATGSFLPQGTAAMWASDAVMRAGGTAMNYYELNTERALRQFGGPDLDKTLATQQQARVPNFVISTAFTALDFLGGPTFDMRVGGIGPYADQRGASLEVSAEMYRPGDRMTLAISSLSRQIFFRSAGLGVSRIVGKGRGEMITGTIGYTDQQRLQEATRDVIGLAVADVLASMPIVPDNCRAMVDALKMSRKAAQPQPEMPAKDKIKTKKENEVTKTDVKESAAPTWLTPSQARKKFKRHK